MAILEALLITPPKSKVVIKSDSSAALTLVKRVLETLRTREWMKISNMLILSAIREVVLGKKIDLFLKKVKGHSGNKWNDRADKNVKKGGEVHTATQLNQVITKNIILRLVWKKIEIECTPREHIKNMPTIAARAEWTFNQEAQDEIHQK